MARGIRLHLNDAQIDHATRNWVGTGELERAQRGNQMLQARFGMEQIGQANQALQVQNQLYNDLLAQRITPQEYMALMDTVGVAPNQIAGSWAQRQLGADKSDLAMLKMMMMMNGMGGGRGYGRGGGGGGMSMGFGAGGKLDPNQEHFNKTRAEFLDHFSRLYRNPETKESYYTPERLLEMAHSAALLQHNNPLLNPVTYMNQAHEQEMERRRQIAAWQAYIEEQTQKANRQAAEARTDQAGPEILRGLARFQSGKND